MHDEPLIKHRPRPIDAANQCPNPLPFRSSNHVSLDTAGRHVPPAAAGSLPCNLTLSFFFTKLCNLVPPHTVRVPVDLSNLAERFNNLANLVGKLGET